MYTFEDLDELYETAEQLPTVDRHDVYARNEVIDEWTKIQYKNSLWTDDGRATGVVSSSKDFYNVIQYGDILESAGKAIERHRDKDLEVDGYISLSPSAHKMSGYLNFNEATTVYASEDDPINLGLKIRSGHSGFHALKYDVGALRQICSNGMMAFSSDLHFQQTHNEPFQPGLAYNAVDAVIESPEEIERRLETAQSQSFLNQDEALIVLMELGIDEYLEQPLPDLLNALYDEVEDPENPTLWETYNAATRALTHYTEDVPDYELDRGFEKAATLLENNYSEVPDANTLGRQVVNQRINTLVENPDLEPHWEHEWDAIQQLTKSHH
ncbi:hypothetical protein C454_11121 [Haloferax gibbonsii ATCC 33959]|uniref:DUF932 domain-containing protein n=1 Tax=Haloferax gibbonsii (strain ATCC 33959 / DSM 4427 / JCM 8863 / NBRC 102184 / NCIMB 2188 / Ma 2.38) TaxID=1227459 RepID=M0H6P6_HALGM|nr:DUF932 domain-containing protein [Haloferax gibbonsii]ELZ80160.1 hypothetical protein C454_11121 [Haloferax gibbonsii ATCC 33959]